MTNLFLENKVTTNRDEFVKKVIYIAGLLNIPPSWLMIVMNFESGLNSKAQNAKSKATGLIQFMPATAKAMGTTPEDLLSMSNVEQLNFVYKYLRQYAGKINSLTDLYLCIFYPYAVTQPDNYTLGLHLTPEVANKIAELNPVFDTDKDGYIKKYDVVQYINNYARRIGYTGEVVKKKDLLANLY